ncbi:serine-rich adhesin for platelets-like [Musca vetustissima]|uniref:serine-rich adhesin for platelets-like n=1 Tax=Musca vetustissima TaxID=27455 RepID=UPI002AB7AF3E|nr:serine-rich adhesin for platelets-like [Musca vetustissima]
MLASSKWVTKSIHLPLTTSLSSAPRVLMCSASVGTEASVTLHLRDVNSNDSNLSSASSAASQSSPAQSQTTSTSANTATTLDNALTIGYPDPEMLADVLGTLQTALNGSLKNRITISKRTSPSNNNNNGSNNNSSSNNVTNIGNKVIASGVQTVSTSTNTTPTSVNKTNSYIKNCLIRSSSCSNTTNITSLAQIMSNSSTSGNGNNNSSNSNSNSNNNSLNSLNHHSNGTLLQQLSTQNNSSNNTSNNNNSCSNSNFSSSSNDSCFSYSSNSSSVPCGPLSSSSSSANNNSSVANSAKILKKNRSKISAPSRHGPQQCQICNKIFGNASALAKHKLTHSDERKYVCVMCSKAFKRQDHLNGHMMTHRNKKPYECKAEGCGKSYCDARSLRRHTENHHAGIVTPHQNQTLSGSQNNNSNSNLSLSPATANGDASSPDGATCLGTYLSNGGTVVDAATGLALTEEELKALNVPLKTTSVTLLSPTSTTTSSSMSSTSSSASSLTSGPGATITLTDNSGNMEGDGLTREQLDLISKIMRQTKQTTAQVTVSSPTSSQSYKIDTNPQPNQQQQVQTPRPRTWNMQLLNSSQNVAITVDEITTDSNAVPTEATVVTTKVKEEEIDIDLSNAMSTNPQLFNLVKIDQKPVECNLCHRKFKNVPALNGHMRLHGGYFKKDPETKKSEKKENSGPPLQTASIGVRALIEEKIISKRSKDLNKGAFVVPAPPSNNNQTNPTTMRRSISDLDSFLNPKQNTINNNGNMTVQQQQNQQQQQQVSTSNQMKNSPKTLINMTEMNLPQSIEIYSNNNNNKQSQQQQQKTMNNIGVGTATASTSNSTKYQAITSSSSGAATTINTTTSRSTSTDPKDSTLIELLKRGTRIAVTQKQPNPNMPLGGISRQIITNKNNCSVIIPSEVQVVTTKGKMKKTQEEQQQPQQHQQQQQMQQQTQQHQGNGNTTTTNLTLADGTPLSLTIAQGSDSNSGEVYTVTYTSDGSGLFGDAEVYNVSEAEMLLQTVDTMQLLSEEGGNGEPMKMEPNAAGINTPTTSEHSEHFEVIESSSNNNNNANELIMQNSTSSSGSSSTTSILSQNNLRSHTLSLPNDLKGGHQFAPNLNSPLHSPLAYPTPPSSHENVTQTSPYIEDNHHFGDSQNIFFSESLLSGGNGNHGDQVEDRVLKLKNVLEDHSFDSNIKVEDLLSGSGADTECDLREFAEANLSFLDEDQEFLSDSRNATSPLSESFFTSGIGTAEEVKEVLREVLTEDQMNLNCESQQENIIDLYYLPGLSLQSQMMPNSEDPLLSSSPRDFGQLKIVNSMQQQQQQQQQLQQMSNIPQQQQQQQQHQMTQNLAYPLQQQQPHQATLKLALDAGGQLATHDVNQLILNLPQQNSQQVTAATTTTSSQNPGNAQMTQAPQQQPTHYMASSQQQQQHINSLNEALMQPIIYATSGTTDKIEIKLEQPAGTAGEGSNISSSSSSNNHNNQVNPQPPPSQQQQQPTRILHTPRNNPAYSSTSLQPLSNQTNSILKRRLKAGGGGLHPHDSSSSQSYSKYQALSPYKSKLRKPSRTHYTPAPILNPERKGHGLYCNVLKELGCSLLSFDNFDDFDDDPVGLVDFSDESKVNLGSAYQASIPAFIANNTTGGTEIEETVAAELMWNPDCQRDEKILMRFIDLSKSSAVPLGSHTEEVALQTLLQAQGNTATAVLNLLQTQSNSFQMKWSSQELECFLKGLEKHGKEFSKISKELGTKSTGECVQMYYFWKKLCVDYKVTHLKTETPPQIQHHTADPKPYVCEIPDCSASFSSKAALHGHTRIHTYGRNTHNNNSNSQNGNSNNNNNASNNSNNNNQNSTNPNASSANTSSASNNNNSNNHQQTTMHSGSNTLQLNGSQSAMPGSGNSKDPNNANKDITEFPCKVCGKVFNKIKSRSAHMKTHRVTDNETSVQITNNQNHAVQQHHNQQQQQQQQQQSQQQQP